MAQRYSPLTVELIEAAYEKLLELPHGPTRLRMQATLCALRDEMALLTGRDPQDIQDDLEAKSTLYLHR